MNHKDVKASLLICTMSFLMTMLLIGTIANHVVASPPAGYGLTWSDEFNGAVGSQANPANWTYDLGYGATNFGNDEQETYTNSYANSHIVSDPNATDGLALQIIASNNNGNITSARLKSLGLHTVQYGYIESRIEAFNPSGDQGIWPAWWMMGENMPSVGWPNCGEIDIMEQWDGLNQNNMSIHGPNMTGDSLTTNGPTNCWINQYHVYGLLWTPTTMTYYVDGVQEASYSQSSSPSWPFNQPFFYLLNIAVGGSGSFTGAWNGSTTWPQTMNVDYIREYQQGAGGAATFTDTATAAPSSVAVNSPVTITENVKDTGAATSGALIDCEVYNSSGTLVNQQYTTGQAFSAGQTQQYAYTWTPTAAGTYTVNIGVYSANWASNYVYNANAAAFTATAGAATFTDTATASPVSVAVNSPVTITETAKDTGAATSGAIIDCEVYNSSGTMVNQQYTTNQTFNAGQSQQYTYTWTPSAAGTYTVHVGVYSANWASNYVYNANAATVTATATAVPAAPTGLTATAGNAQVALSWTASSSATSYNVYRGTISGGESSTSIATGITTITYTNTGLTNGTAYYYKVAAVNSAGTSGYSNEASATPAVPPSGPSFTDTATASPASVAVNSTVTITETVKDTGAATSGALIDCEVYNSSGTMVFQNYTTGQTFSAGQSQQYTYTWTPSTAGAYTVNVGVFSANWASTYVYNSNVATVTVTSAVQSGTYSIVSVQSGLAVDGGANTSGTHPQLFGSNGTADQQWKIAPSGSGYSIISVQSGLALDAGANTSGANPQLIGSTGAAAQQWQITASGGGYSITSVPSGLALDGGANASGTNPQLYGSNGTADQQWKLVVD